MADKARRRSGAVTLGITALLAAGLTGCGGGDDDPDYGAVCVDQQTQQRVDDSRCDDGSHGGGGLGLVGWYFLSRGVLAPAIGQRAVGGTFTQPATGTIRRGGLNPNGGKVARGGFGKSGGGKGISGRSGG